jgi:Fe-S cluster assembly scaffold IscU
MGGKQQFPCKSYFRNPKKNTMMLKQAAKKALGLTSRQSTPWSVGILRTYHENVIDHYDNPRNVGSFDKNDPNVGTGLVGAPACGDVMKLQIKVDEKTGQIVDARFKTFGCGSAIASSSVATEWVKGKAMEDVLTIKNTEIAKHLSLPPVKLHCSMLAEDAIKAAVKDYKEKRVKTNGAAAAGETTQA